MLAVVLAVCFTALSPALAQTPLPEERRATTIDKPYLGPELLAVVPVPSRPAEPTMSPDFILAPTPIPAPTPVPAAPITASAPSGPEPAAGSLDPAVDGVTRSNFPWGAGVASWYGPGNGVAMHYCSWTYRNSVGCGSVRITSLDTGRSVLAPVIDYCQCYWGTAQQRLVDLQTGLLGPLGLSSSAGLYRITVEPAN